ncbi:hypothetical protein [Pleionea sediminis]|uniref:hypothetical protein n=1 Tax=Pleionea sediminis TaxID=2569479 RepID=UPI00118671B3|nr:hypothetical protein [Pleionea sediminis]
MTTNSIVFKPIPQQRDYVAMWFEARKEFGISDSMNVARLNLKDNSAVWQTFPHSKMDGLGGMATLMRNAGYPSRQLPKSSEKEKPSFWQLIKLLFKQPKPLAAKTIRWKKRYNIRSSTDGEIAYDFLSSDETNRVKKLARANRVTLNHYVLWALNRAIATHLLDEYQDYYWLYPVNLRGPLNFNTDIFNYSSSINLCVNNTMTPKKIQERVKEQLKAKAYWINWYMANIGRLVGMWGIKKIYQFISKRQFFAGSFSFLGQWPLNDHDNPPKNPDEMWVTCGIGTRNYPVSTGVLLWYDRLSLGIKLHPSICKDHEITKQCLSDWKKLLLEGSELQKTISESLKYSQ